MSEDMKITYADCVVNAAIQLTTPNGPTTVAELQARAAMAEAWLHLGETLKSAGWVDIPKKTIHTGIWPPS